MAKTKRREMLASLGMLGGSVLLGTGAHIVGAQGAAAPASPEAAAPVQACPAGHGSKGRGDAFGKRSCAACHRLPDRHP